MTTGEDEFAGIEAERVSVGDAELAGLVSAAGLGVVVGGGVAGTGAVEAEDGVGAGVTPMVAAGGGLMSR